MQKTTDEMLSEAQMAINTHNYEEAEKLLKKILRHDRHNSDAKTLLDLAKKRKIDPPRDYWLSFVLSLSSFAYILYVTDKNLPVGLMFLMCWMIVLKGAIDFFRFCHYRLIPYFSGDRKTLFKAECEEENG